MKLRGVARAGMTHMKGGAWLAAVIAGLLAVPLRAAPAHAQEHRGLAFVGGVAYERGGPGPSLVDELIAAGYDDQRPQPCPYEGCEVEETPFYFDEGLNLIVLLGVRYYFHPMVSIEGLGSNGPRGHAEGYDFLRGEHLIVAYSSLMFATTLGAHLGPIRIEAGPVLNSTGWNVTRNSFTGSGGRTSVVGSTAGLGGSLRLADVILSIKAAIRRFGRTELPPAVQIPLAPEYHSFFVGVTVSPILH